MGVQGPQPINGVALIKIDFYTYSMEQKLVDMLPMIP